MVVVLFAAAVDVSTYSTSSLGFRLLGPAAPGEIIPVLLAVTQNNVHQLERVLLAVSDPDSDQYGKHRSANEFHTLTANPKGTREVISCLRNSDYTEVVATRTGDYVRATTCVLKAPSGSCSLVWGRK